jgi:hypothetical protein
MASVAGKNGSVSFTGLTAGTKAWNLTYSGEVVDTTKYSDQPTRTFLGTVTTWSASVTGFFDTANTAVPLDSATLTLTVTTGETYAGTAIMTGMNPGSTVDGVTTCDWTFQGSGVLTITSA